MRKAWPIHRSRATDDQHQEIVRRLDTLVSNQSAATGDQHREIVRRLDTLVSNQSAATGDQHREIVRRLDTLVDNQSTTTQAIKELPSQLERMQPTKRRGEKVLPWIEGTTSIGTVLVLIATVVILFLTYEAVQDTHQALHDSNAQLALGRRQLNSAQQAAQPSFRLKFFTRTGTQCVDLRSCKPVRITFHLTGAADPVDYGVSEQLIFSKNPQGPYYISPWLNNWEARKDPAILTLVGPSQLPSNLKQYSRTHSDEVYIVYVIDAFYTDAFGVGHLKRWVLANPSSFGAQPESLQRTCAINVFAEPRELRIQQVRDSFNEMISSRYKITDLIKYSHEENYDVVNKCL
jgi:hypothetical protein